MSQAHHDPNDFSAQQQPTPSPDARTQRLVWQPRPKPKWPPDDFSQDAFEQRRRERLEEIRLVFARVAAGLPIKEDEDTGGRPGGTPGVQTEAAACTPGVSPGNPAESDPLTPEANVDSPPTLPGTEAEATRNPSPVPPASLPGRPPKAAPKAAHATRPQKPPRAPTAAPTGPTRYSAYHERERPTRRWPEQASQPERPKRPWVSPQPPKSQYPAPNAIWPSEPIYLPVPEAPPALEQTFKRPPPTLGKIAPLPAIDYSITDGAWKARFAALDTSTDLLYVLLVGINAVIQVRKEHWAWMDWQDALPLRPPHGLLQRPLPGLWDSPLLPWQPEGTLTVLQTEVEQLIRVLEVVRVNEPEPLGAQVETLRQEAIQLRLKRLEQVVRRLRPEMNKRRAVRRVAEMLAQLAWRSLESLFLPEMPTRRL